MTSKIKEKKWCATYSRCINALAEYQRSGDVTLYLVMDERAYTFPDGFHNSAEEYISHREKIGIIKKSNKVCSLYLERFFCFFNQEKPLFLDDLLIFPVAVCDVIHDAVHADTHELVQCRFLCHAIPPFRGVVS